MSTNQQFYGTPQGLIPSSVLCPAPIIAQREPETTDYKYPIGQLWVDEPDQNYYGLVGVTANSATWNLLAAASGAIATLTDDSDTAADPTAANIKLAGTSDQIATTAGSSVITFSIPDTFVAPGSIASTSTLTAGSSLAVTTSAVIGTTLTATGGLTTLAALTAAGTAHINITGSAVTTIGTGGTGAVNIGNATGNTAVTGSLTTTTTLTATLGNITATNGDLNLVHTGNKLLMHYSSGTSATDAIGIGTLNGSGTVTITTSACTAASMIFCQVIDPSGVGSPGVLSVPSATIESGSFVVNSSVATDASTFFYFIVN